MKPSAKTLERLVKKAVKGQEFRAEDLLFHWQELGTTGDRVVIDVLNDTNGWDSFVKWASLDADARRKLEAIAESPGIPEEAAVVFRETGIGLVEGDSARLRAQWVERVALKQMRGEWVRARAMLVADEDMLAGALSLLKRHDSPDVLSFLSTLLEEPLNREQDRAVRKLMYRLKQKGIGATEIQMRLQSEMFSFGENRVPMWQPIFYFRAHSTYSDAGDLFVISITEGQSFEISEQRSDLRLTPEAWKRIIQLHTESLQRQSGIEIRYHDIAAEQARFLLQRSYSMMENQPRARGLADFLKFLATREASDPFVNFERETQNAGPGADFLDHSFFAAWIIAAPAVGGFLERARELEQGPIVLPESQLRERKSELTRQAINDYFSAVTRDLWAFAFEKAAFYLKDSDSPAAIRAWAIAQDLRNREKTAESIPAAVSLFERTIRFVEQQKKAEEEQEKQASLIMSPEEFQKQYRRK